jgi:putative redox protein
MIESKSEQANAFPQAVNVRGVHTFRADVGAAMGSADAAPGPHDLFDAALATCKALTAIWYARHNQIPLERVETKVESDNSKERQGVYAMKVSLAFHGPLSEEQRKRLYAAVEKCPIHKLMTTAEIVISTEPLGPEHSAAV